MKRKKEKYRNQSLIFPCIAPMPAATSKRQLTKQSQLTNEVQVVDKLHRVRIAKFFGRISDEKVQEIEIQQEAVQLTDGAGAEVVCGIPLPIAADTDAK